MFGTDGIRGRANQGDLTPHAVVQLGIAAGTYFRDKGDGRRVLIGKDTRRSGYMLETALTAGLVAAGLDPFLVGPLPTPAVAYLTRSLRADFGIMITASHNPYEDNGLKLFGPDGFKLSDEEQAAIASLAAEDLTLGLAAPGDMGKAQRLDDAQGRYIEFAKHSLDRGVSLTGLKIVLDCAHGAAYRVAPKVLWELGAEVVMLGNEPNGSNINRDCGSTQDHMMRSRVLAERADLGVALDGDADRVIISNEQGALIDGDQILALVAATWQDRGKLKGGGVVGTVMSNLGLERHLESKGLTLHRTPVGDRHVVQRMRETGCNLGGESSGHVVIGDVSTTGDGLIAALQVLASVKAANRPASEVCQVFEPVPQVLRNMRVDKRPALDAPNIQSAIRNAEARLGLEGRLLVRLSGTEPVVRIMAEGGDVALLGEVVDDVVNAVAA